ncbi:unnamed protein product [Brachionus calyciflorus]|uniref:EIF3j n=1 Tax=Brachionus calyciflorus TaxID=104777 RepID=A0A813Q473_9BILA|nr:unnamed protein product [Brachionus calyciflorus]
MSGWVKDSWEDEDENVSRPVVKESWDDEEEVKESWEDEEEEEKPKVVKPAVAKPKAPVAQKPIEEMTEEEKKEAQLKADLQHTQELFGLSKSLDEISLKSKEDYLDFIDRFYARVNVHSGTSLYVDFLEELFKTLSKNLNADKCKKLANTMRITYEAKANEEKQLKAKEQKPKPKSKSRLKTEFDNIKGDFDTFVREDFLNDDDEDFM